MPSGHEKGRAQLHACAQRSRRRRAGQFYSVQSKTATGSSDSQVWISTATGLPLRQSISKLEQGMIKMKNEVRFDYANARAPAGVSR